MTTLIIDGHRFELAKPLPSSHIGGTAGWLQQSMFRGDVLNLDTPGGWLIVNLRAVRDVAAQP